MPAGVVIGARTAFVIARYDQLLIADRPEKVVAGLGNLLEATDADPVPVPYGAEFLFVVVFIEVPFTGQGSDKFGVMSHERHLPFDYWLPGSYC